MSKNYYYADLIDSTPNKPRGDGSFYDGMKTVPMTIKRFKQPKIHGMQKPDPREEFIPLKRLTFRERDKLKAKRFRERIKMEKQFFNDYAKQCKRSQKNVVS